MEIDICINQDRTEVRGMEPYELWSNGISVYIDLLCNVCTAIIKLLIILACMITTCINIFNEILVIYVIQFSSDLLQMLVHELQDLLMLKNAGHYMTNCFRSLLQQKTQEPMPALSSLVLVFFLLLCKVFMISFLSPFKYV